MSKCWGYKINPNNSHIMLHSGPSFEFLKERGWVTGFNSRQEALNAAREEVKKLNKE